MRQFRGWAAGAVTAIACTMALFHLYTGGIQAMAAQWQRGLHVAFGLVLIFILVPASKKEKIANSKLFMGLDLGLAGLTVAFTYYYLSTLDEMIFRQGLPNTMDIIMSTIAIVVVLEATRRTIGWVLVAIAGGFFAYALFGDLFPMIVSHPGMGWDWVSSFLFLSTEGIYGIPIGVTATFVFLFVLFANAIQESGGDHLIADMGAAFLGRTRGGSGKATVFTGLTVGMISGSPVADAAAVGALTIPTMKQKGFTSMFAASLAAVAANGGAFMPPVMGAAAFIMVEFTGMTYWEICRAALIPAVLFYFSIYMATDFEAGRRGIPRIPRHERPKVLAVLKRSLIIVVPFLVLLYTMGVMAVTPQKSAALAFFSLVAIYLVQQGLAGKMTPAAFLKYLVRVFESGARGMLVIVATCACSGMIVGIINVTGLGVQLSSIALEISGGQLLPLLFLTMVASIILGMGLTVTAVYIILAVLAAPALIQIGVTPIGAHLFVFYFGIVSGLTPPVALTSYVTAGIAKTPVFQTSFRSFLLGLVAFLIPFVWIYNPGLILVGPFSQTLYSLTMCIVSIIALAAGIQGYLFGAANILERAMLVSSSILIIVPDMTTTVIGGGLLLIALAVHWLRTRQLKSGALATETSSAS